MHSTPREESLVVEVGPPGSKVLCCPLCTWLTQDLFFTSTKCSFSRYSLVLRKNFTAKLKELVRLRRGVDGPLRHSVISDRA